MKLKLIKFIIFETKNIDGILPFECNAEDTLVLITFNETVYSLSTGGKKLLVFDQFLLKDLISKIQTKEVPGYVVDIPEFSNDIIHQNQPDFEKLITNDYALFKLLTKLYRENAVTSITIMALTNLDKTNSRSLIQWLHNNEMITRYYSTYKITNENKTLIMMMLDELKSKIGE